MTMGQIEPKDIAKRLQSLGYNPKEEFDSYPENWSKKDKYLIEYSITIGLNDVSMNLNREIDSFEDSMRNHIINIICSFFLNSIRDIGITEDGSIITTGEIKTTKEGSLTVEYENNNTQKNTKSELDEMIDFLKKQSYQSLSKYRKLYHI